MSTTESVGSQYLTEELVQAGIRSRILVPKGKLGLALDNGEPILLDGAGAGPSGSGRDRNLEPPTDSDDSDFEELSRRDFDAALASHSARTASHTAAMASLVVVTMASASSATMSAPPALSASTVALIAASTERLRLATSGATATLRPRRTTPRGP